VRILQLDVDGQRIEFHPYVTVLRGLDTGLRAKLIDALSSISDGRPTVDGLVEAHGVVLDLTDETLRVLDLHRNGAASFDIVVRHDQLPGTVVGRPDSGSPQPSPADRAARVARAEADLDRANRALAASRDALARATSGDAGSVDLGVPRAELGQLGDRRRELEANAEAARLAHAKAQEAQTVAEERAERARALRGEATRACSVAAGALEAARAVRDPFAAGSLDAARERLATLEASAAAGDEANTPAPLIGDDIADPEAELAALDNRRLELEAALLAVDTVDPFAVETALRQLESAEPEGELVPSEDAMRLADALVEAGGPVTGQADDDTASGKAIAAARKRLDAARAGLFEAESAVRLPEVDRLDVEALENAHEEVLIAQDRADKRFAGSRAEERLDEVRQAEQDILDRLGFRTYTDFVLGTSIVNVDPEREHRLDAARAELAVAEDELATLEAGVDAELARAELVSRRRELHAEAIALLGRDPGDDVEWALRHHRVRVYDGTNRADRLHEALRGAGMVIDDDDLPSRLLVELARIWLDEQSETAERREQTERELAEVESRLTRVAEVVRIRSEEPTLEEVEEAAGLKAVRRQAQLDEARNAVRAAEQRLERQTQVDADIAERKAELESATQAEAAVATALAEAEADAVVAAEAEQGAARERARCEAALTATLAAERQASESLDSLADRLSRAAQGDPTDLEQAVAEAEASVAQATAALESAGRDADGGAEVSGPTAATPNVEELEWYLLSRIAAQRSVSYAGSVPLVLDDALANVGGGDLVHLLSRLERMSSAVQVVLVSDDDAVAAWADSVGADRAMTVSASRA
jgi:hypothetical protein